MHFSLADGPPQWIIMRYGWFSHLMELWAVYPVDIEAGRCFDSWSSVKCIISDNGAFHCRWIVLGGNGKIWVSWSRYVLSVLARIFGVIQSVCGGNYYVGDIPTADWIRSALKIIATCRTTWFKSNIILLKCTTDINLVYWWQIDIIELTINIM